MSEKDRLVHGGDWMGYEMEYGKEPLDFSMNVNPFGIPEEVAKAIAGAAPLAFRYPDPECRRLRTALSGQEGVPAEWILCGSGAADLIDRIALACGGMQGDAQRNEASSLRGEGKARYALVTAPTFSEYEEALIRCGWSVGHWPLKVEDGFAMTEEFLSTMEANGNGLPGELNRPDILFLCEPNNPTGVTTDRLLLERILRACCRAGIILVIDECFHEFLDEPEEHTMKAFLAEYPNLILLRAFTKFYGMAGVRLGYCLCSDPEMLNRIKKAGQPWNVSLLAEEAGLAALKEDGWAEKTRQLIRTERTWLRQRLQELGAEYISGEANYLLFRWPADGKRPESCMEPADSGKPGPGAAPAGEEETACETLAKGLRRRGILIRSADNYAGLGAGWYRTAVRMREENQQLITALEEIGSGENSSLR